jgi:hypothetical protein
MRANPCNALKRILFITDLKPTVLQNLENLREKGNSNYAAAPPLSIS